jgi:hypothetical protein
MNEWDFGRLRVFLEFCRGYTDSMLDTMGPLTENTADFSELLLVAERLERDSKTIAGLLRRERARKPT